MFNLDSLNKDRSETMQDRGWAKGCTLESPDSFIQSLVQRADRGRFRFELGGSSNGPRLVATQEAEIQNNMKGIGKLAHNSIPSSHGDFELDGDSTSNG
nr:hypothetical protein CFP56_76665 [Quercus suber]